MGSEETFYLLEQWQDIPVTDAQLWLGRIVNDYRRPVAGYTPDNSTPPTFKYHCDTEYSDLTGIIEKIGSNAIRVSLLDMFGISHENFKSNKHQFSSRKIERWRVHQDADVLDLVLQNPEVILALEKWHFSLLSPLYLIVGLLVTEDIAYHTQNKQKQHIGGSIDPIQIAGVAAGVPIPFKSDVGVKTTTGKNQDKKLHAHGKRVFAVEYRSFRKVFGSRSKSPQGRLKGYGPRGDRSFTSTGDVVEDEEEVEFCLDPESFMEIVEGDVEVERCFKLDKEVE